MKIKNSRTKIVIFAGVLLVFISIVFFVQNETDSTINSAVEFLEDSGYTNVQIDDTDLNANLNKNNVLNKIKFAAENESNNVVIGVIAGNKINWTVTIFK